MGNHRDGTVTLPASQMEGMVRKAPRVGPASSVCLVPAIVRCLNLWGTGLGAVLLETQRDLFQE